MIRYILILVFGLSLANSVFAEESLQDFPGSIPLTDERGHATDLVSPEGLELFPDEVDEYKDPSLLNPIESDLWSEEVMDKVPEPPIQEKDEELKYIEDVAAPHSWQTFTVSKEAKIETETDEIYQILLSKKAHNVLMRAELLRKLGYKVPPLKYIKKFKLVFPSKAVRDDFLNTKMTFQLGALPDRWATNVYKRTVKEKNQSDTTKWKVYKKTEDCNCLYIQDALVMNASSHMYNLAIGVVDKSQMQGRRVFEALLVAFGLTYVQESYNLLSWEFGKILNDRVFIEYEYSHHFYPTYDDAKWIVRKILKLSPQDWVDIVKYAQLPRAVEKLAIEKLKSRRNSLRETFKFKSDFKRHRVKYDVYRKYKGGYQLKDGKLLQLEWRGYAPHFGFGDPDSPITKEEIIAFGKSKFKSSIMSHLVNVFNSRIINNGLSSRISQKNYDVFVDALVDSAVNKKQLEIPLDFYSLPYAGANLIASREIIAGNISGAKNPIQLSHTFGYSVKLGNYTGFHGLPSGISANARLEGYYTRTYSHMQPVLSIKKALKEPFKNIAVKVLAKEIGEKLKAVHDGDFDALKKRKDLTESDKSKVVELQEILTEFTKHFAVGESLVLSEHLGASAALSASKSIDSLEESISTARLNLSAKADKRLISRFYIYRESDSVVQIYDHKGESLKVNISVGIDLNSVKFIEAEFVGNYNGKAKTEFRTLDIDSSQRSEGQLRNDNLVNNLKILYHVISGFDKEILKNSVVPTVLTHNFSQSGWNLSLFWLKESFLNGQHTIHVSHNKDEATYLRGSKSYRSGSNWEGFVSGLTSALVNQKLKTPVNLNAGANKRDPGATFKGHSRAKKIFVESKVKGQKMYGPYIRIENRWRGWSADRKRIDRIFKEVNLTYPVRKLGGVPLLRKFDLKDMRKIQLYTVQLDMHIYTKGAMKLLDISKDAMVQGQLFKRMPKDVLRARTAARKKIKNVIRNYARTLGDNYHAFQTGGDSDVNSKREEWVDRQANEYYRLTRKFYKKYSEKDLAEAYRIFSKMIDHLDSNTKWVDFTAMLGGRKNIYIQASINGFRVGDENTVGLTGLHSPYLSNSFGVIGSRKSHGPLSFLSQNLGIKHSELFLSWMKESL